MNAGMGTLKKSQIISAAGLLSVSNLSIPDYQRPYKWGKRNISVLLTDIENAIEDSKKYSGPFYYRLGTIILHNNEKNNSYDVVDGQQRCLSLLLIKLYLEPDFKDCTILLKNRFKNFHSRCLIRENYNFIKSWFASKGDEEKQEFSKAFSEILQVVVLVVDKRSDAFQLFDSQNSRGREPDSPDLLKAYHLREMRNYPVEEQHRAVTRWEAAKPDDISKLFKDYLFPILNWARKESTRPFTAQEIAAFKGISRYSSLSYPFAERALKAMPVFQITEDFMAGKDFFNMVDHYLQLLKDVQLKVGKVVQDLLSPEKFEGGCTAFATWTHHAKLLYECAVLCYYDRFQNFDPAVMKKLLVWAFMIRVDMSSLAADTINLYALGRNGGKYSNALPVFVEIVRAKLHTEVSNLQVNTMPRENNKLQNRKWQTLHDLLKQIKGD